MYGMYGIKFIVNLKNTICYNNIHRFENPTAKLNNVGRHLYEVFPPL